MSWAATLQDGLERSQRTLHQTARSLARCWQELLERALVSAFSVQTHTVGQQIQMAYNRKGQLTSVTDAKSYVTSWAYDLQGRLTSKQYADTSTATMTIETRKMTMGIVRTGIGCWALPKLMDGGSPP